MKNLEIEKIHELFLTTTSACTDTRAISEGCMFFALKGENFNGNTFVKDALNAGAAYAVTEDAANEQECEEKCILVDDVLDTLQQLARYHRLKHKLPVIALTGTNGKTTTKELIAATLRTQYNIVATQGNLNNHIGVPLTLLRITDKTQVAVIEMGASAPGEIDVLMKIACPSFGLITNVGKAHLQGFGSFEGVKKAKGELYDNLMDHRKIAFVNVDNPILMDMVKEHLRLQIVPYGVKNDNAKVSVTEGDTPYLKVTVPNPSAVAVAENNEPEFIEISSHLIGIYNVDNILAALCVSSYLAVPTMQAVKAIEDYTPSNNRSQLEKTRRNTLIIDAYNANPTSMRAAVENFREIKFKHKILILGDMLELGEDSLQEHKEIISLANSYNPDKIYLVGGEFRKAYLELESGLSGRKIELFEDSLKLAEELKNKDIEGCIVLIKGSRGIRLERVVEVL